MSGGQPVVARDDGNMARQRAGVAPRSQGPAAVTRPARAELGSPKGVVMKRWFAVGTGAMLVYAFVKAWPDLVRYQRIRSM